MPPPRTLITLAAALLIGVMIVCAVVWLPRARGVGGTRRERTLVAVALAVILGTVVAWLLAVFPAYWD